MEMRDYFDMDPETQASMRRKLTRRLEDFYIVEVTDPDYEDDLSFEDFLQRTISDMEVVENYEGAAIVRDIIRIRKWK